MRRHAFVALAVAFAAALLYAAAPGPSLALDSVADQKQEVITSGFAAAGTFAQTFLPGRSGQLTSVDLYLWSDVAANVSVSVAGTDKNGFPAGGALASKTDVVQAQGWYSFPFAAPPSVVAGTRYAIELTMTSTKGGAFGSTAGWYARGRRCCSSRPG